MAAVTRRPADTVRIRSLKLVPSLIVTSQD
jgi:hypothetical protein